MDTLSELKGYKQALADVRELIEKKSGYYESYLVFKDEILEELEE